ncbi:uncharacterized protein LOC121855539 [Homarus americanus]|uniref:uncharacterized protein LOC121855539 n=1 Tax=Homarus americanus TaxID=6706 RepID=UPI001C446FC1|nr:uncharacterized protein LOC121855539 [Homarus americanus]XP_042206457.1 uncharacterized protein LOC121855539 [Homarus americanus]
MAGPAPRIHLSRASSSVSEDRDDHYHHERDDGAASEDELWSALTPEHLLLLHQHFCRPRGWTGRASLAGQEDTPTKHLSRPQFIEAVTNLLGSDRYEGVCGAIFDTVVVPSSRVSPSLASSGVSVPTTIMSSSTSSNISSSSNSSAGGTLGISWAGVVSYLAGVVAGGGQPAPSHPLFSPTPRYRLLTYNKREGVAGVVVCRGRRALLVVGARGSLTKLTHGKWRYQQYSRLLLDSTPDEEQQTPAPRKVSLGTWVVDVALVEDGVAVVAASSSTLHLVEMTAGVAQEMMRITNLPALPSCLAAG